MERGAGRQRGGEEETVEVEETGAAGQWGEAEVLALLSVWGELGAAQHSGVSSRDAFECISEQLRGLSVLRDWRECQAQCRRLGLQARKAESPGTFTNYNQGAAAMMDAQMTPSDLEEEDLTSEKEAHSSLVTMQEGGPCQILHGALPYAQCMGPEGGRHWTDEEVRALLCVWSDRHVRQRLKGTLRNKAIFQEMARRMQRGFGVVRNWKQCRTKYKNLKYEYKMAKSAQAAAGSSGSGPGRYMKFFDEMEAILLDSGFDGKDGHQDMQRRGPEVDQGAGRLETLGGQTQSRAPKGDLVIEIDDDNSDDYELDTDQNQRESEAHISPLDQSSSEQFHVVTVSDTGRNWSDQEVRALIQVWSEEGVCRQLQSSTRKRDIFVQISCRLLQQGVERDWKQCHTKYKNLKYLYRSLQRGRADGTDPRHLMRFYDEVDAILTRSDSGPAMGYEEQAEAGAILAGAAMMGNDDGKDAIFMMSDRATARMGHEERTHPVNSYTAQRYEVIPRNEDKRTYTGNAEMDKKEDLTAKRELKRKALDQGLNYTRRPVKRHDTGGSCAESIDLQYKEEEDQYIPIIEINSVCSMAASDSIREKQGCKLSSNMASPSELKLGRKLNEGKTKQIFELADEPGHVLVQSKDQITAGNAARKDQMEGKAAIANRTTSCVFKLLREAGIKTAFVRQQSETAFVAAHCEMIPIEWVCRRVATGSFLKRNPGVKEGYRFSPLKMEMFFKDDANNDPQWSEEQLLETKLSLAGLTIGRCEVDIMNRSTVAIFEVLERAWATQNCTLVDMKIEFGVNVSTKEIVLADVIDNDSWRLWPAGDRSQQKDKQVYRDLKEVTPEAMQMVKRNFEWVSERVKRLLEPQASGRVVVLMGSISDLAHCEKIRKACGSYGIPCDLRVTSAHKGPDETLRIKAEYEGDGVPTVFVAVAGRSNGLGPVMSGNTAYPVINCPPITPNWGAQDIWSSLRMPSGLGCSTVLSPEAAAQFAAQIFGLSDHMVWSKLRASMLNTWLSLKQADKKLQACSL
ncbi:multifunctional protein ADE2 isoform X1 [Coregonus clupeaformis]|uniref:multifunctional protein ADE2 isoform X1 n=2 Tax=Coregonus clupeaformis TaxID=59861 RepID=UPI001BE035E4|nr:multifunctional protein ADE2 isoform X1 [Coregonus clupeaformis]